MGFEFTLELARRFREFRRDWRSHAELIRELAFELFGENLVGVYVFGSTIRGDHGALSDIDVAVVLKEVVDEESRARLMSLVRRRLGAPHPFELHVITEREWVDWYSRFVKGEFVEV
ncbi:MAG: nucleotidyltransferase domain-containing protein [Candidatus Korarchaeum sp.]